MHDALTGRVALDVTKFDWWKAPLRTFDLSGGVVPSETSNYRHLVCTIATPNYLGQLLVLGQSLAVTMPTVDFRVLVLQDCADVTPVQSRLDAYLAEVNSSANHRALAIDECHWG